MERSGWSPWRVARAAARVALAAWLVSLGGVLLWGARDAARPADAIVVLGAAQYAGRPSPVLRARLEHALALWRVGLAPRVIVTGGKAEGDVTTEAATGRGYLRRMGVPDGAIVLEDGGRTTAESLSAVARMLAAEGGPAPRATCASGTWMARFFPARRPAVILVSDPFHMMRLQMLAWRFGLCAFPSPTTTSPISTNRMASIAYVLSESVKVPLAPLLAGWPGMGR